MKITLLTIGKTDKKYLIDSIEEYNQRLTHYCKFDFKSLPDIKNSKNLTHDQQMQKECELIQCNLKGSYSLFLLDEHGKQYTSMEFASFIQQKMNLGSKDVIFVIGGPYGFSKELKETATGLISLSKMTFSHQMVRLIFVEQLYRAMTIIKGEPYHHQ
jgi:23S rRNA (pseudouridine1915-N3)-methyltransferase